MRGRFAGAATVALLAQLALAPLPTGAHGPTASVNFHYAEYVPASVRITPGGTVTFTPDAGSSFDAQDPVNGHPLHFDDPTIGDQSSGTDPITRTFTNPGVYTFECLHHGPAGMRGTVVVTLNHPPVASFVAPASAQQGTPVTLDASSSLDEDPGQTLMYAWDFDNDGTIDQTTTAPTVTHTFTTPGSPTVRLRVTDNNSDAVGPESSEMTQPITITPAPGGGHSGDRGKSTATVAIRLPARRPRLGQLAHRGLPIRATSSSAGLAEAALKRGARTLGRGSTGFVAAGTRSLTIRLTPAGRRALAHVRRATLAVTVVLTDESGAQARVTRSVTLRR